ncbi:hypothetical protein MKX03_023485 [Papaver bracteatum]|nr:hypothetical protein MKX03_023485 [Papaver bracteatum]
MVVVVVGKSHFWYWLFCNMIFNGGGGEVGMMKLTVKHGFWCRRGDGGGF